jgi:hypothetical protein
MTTQTGTKFAAINCPSVTVIKSQLRVEETTFRLSPSFVRHSLGGGVCGKKAEVTGSNSAISGNQNSELVERKRPKLLTKIRTRQS